MPHLGRYDRRSHPHTRVAAGDRCATTIECRMMTIKDDDDDEDEDDHKEDHTKNAPDTADHCLKQDFAGQVKVVPRIQEKLPHDLDLHHCRSSESAAPSTPYFVSTGQAEEVSRLATAASALVVMTSPFSIALVIFRSSTFLAEVSAFFAAFGFFFAMSNEGASPLSITIRVRNASRARTLSSRPAPMARSSGVGSRDALPYYSTIVNAGARNSKSGYTSAHKTLQAGVFTSIPLAERRGGKVDSRRRFQEAGALIWGSALGRGRRGRRPVRGRWPAGNLPPYLDARQ